MKKYLSMILAAAVMFSAFTACGSNMTEDTENDAFGGTITVISREEGSGTRGAFIELTGVETKDAAGNKVDNTTIEAVVLSKTDAVLTNVSTDKMAIGYISMGSLNDTVKAVAVDGVQPATVNVKNGSYSISRPFNIATNGDMKPEVQDFISFIMSKQGQEIVSGSYITVNDTADEYTPAGISGKITVSGSSSVSPLMEKLMEAYMNFNPDVEIELTTTDSTGGLKDAMNGVSDIGMASRELKESEASLTGTTIAMDGIAVIVNNENPVNSLTLEQITQIYTGRVTMWEEIA
ncbi:MAG: substrate-binding domain-containing protein [Oscillospiraceae bacterium]|nr:substrate-binding domain-containing protein [Oscillospiraceae bacterium]